MLTFAIAAIVLVMMPGPDQVLITRNALAGGLWGGLMTLVGGAFGLTVHASAAALGLSALLLASSTAFTVLKIVGVAYLLWLGVQTLRAARKSRREPADDGAIVAPQRRWAYLRQGFLSNALNPKVALFFLAFVPQFIYPDATGKALAFLILGVIFNFNGTLWNLFVAWSAARVATQLSAAGRWTAWLARAAGRTVREIESMVAGRPQGALHGAWRPQRRRPRRGGHLRGSVPDGRWAGAVRLRKPSARSGNCFGCVPVHPPDWPRHFRPMAHADANQQVEHSAEALSPIGLRGGKPG